MLKTLDTRIPEKRNVVTVYAVATFLVYTWTLFTSFWKLPSWLFFLQPGEIVSIYSYAFLINFLESILLLLLALVPAFLLPARWWKDHFVPRAFILILTVLGSTIIHLSVFGTPDQRPVFVNGQWIWWIGTLLIAVFLTWLAGSVDWIRHGLENMADRFMVFLYIYLPLTAFSLLVLVFRFFA